MTLRLAALLVVASLLAGCSLPEDEAEGGGGAATGPPLGSCPDVAEASASAPLLASMQDDPEAIARRLGEALGGNVTGPPEPLPGGEIRWRDGNVTLTVTPGEDGVRAAWTREGAWAPDRAEAEATLRRALAAFSPPDPDAFDVVPGDGEGSLRLDAIQTYEGRRIQGAGAELTSGERAHVAVTSLREVRPGLELLDESRAVDVAKAAARCALDQRGQTEAAGHGLLEAASLGLGAKGSSLAWLVQVTFAEPGEPSHCGHVERVPVDAVTGKVLGIAPPGCD